MQDGEERKEMISIMKKRSRLLALAAVAAFLVGELAGFAVPKTAMAETTNELNEYTMRVIEDTLVLNAVNDFYDISAKYPNLPTYSEFLKKDVRKTYTIYVDGIHPNYEIYIPIKINGITGTGQGGSVKSLQSVNMGIVYGHDDNLWSTGVLPGANYNRADHDKEFKEKFDLGQPVDASFNITYRGCKQEDGNCCPYIYLEYKDAKYTICPIKVEFKLNGKSKTPKIITDKLPGATISENYTAKIEAENINEAEFKSDDLPDWLSLDKTSGKISGIPRKTGEYGFTVTVTGKDGDGAEVRLSKDYFIKVNKPSDKDDDDDDDHHHHHDNEPLSWEKNPNEKSALVMTGSGLGAGVTAGRQEQGEIAKTLFKAATPAGWNEAFSFNILVNGKADYSLKTGTFTLQIPAEYQKAGRQFAILAMSKNGQIVTLTDTDTNPNTITVNVNFEGYAMDLIFKD